MAQYKHMLVGLVVPLLVNANSIDVEVIIITNAENLLGK